MNPGVASQRELIVTEFDCAKMTKKNPCILLVGARGSGKSVLLKDILYRFHLAGVPRACIFSQTEGANHFFSDFVPGLFVHSPLDLSTLTRVFEKQKDLFIRKELKQVPADANIRLVLVLDDCAYDKKIMNSKVLREIYFNGRHYGIILIVTLQYMMALNVDMRTNVDTVFFMAENVKKNRERVHEQFCAFFEEFSEFQGVFSTCTANYESFVVNNVKGLGPDPCNYVHWYKADIGLQYKFGPPSLWRFHNRRFESEMDKYLRLQRDAATRQVASPVTPSGGEPASDPASGGPASSARSQSAASRREAVMAIKNGTLTVIKQ